MQYFNVFVRLFNKKNYYQNIYLYFVQDSRIFIYKHQNLYIPLNA